MSHSRYEREFKTVKTKSGPVRVKLGFWQGRLIDCSPEYEDCREIAARRGIPLKDVYEVARAACRERLGRGQ